ncbi:molybdate ABC transporter substrate-binding protein [Motilibacter sp. E257]|uniref:Molybdate ABC transporter substrate-binding protein n=2 Tax=Motilibacter deserti TaxID=2714956 RepID=A0ABX0GXT9_9ACTN|nr:molybdate ABC transporter substrate-binding protein [Motilibacter deserti]NHC15806.1 molybdate ABC transporter substrate-binding protein [Motilibacter deserti]
MRRILIPVAALALTLLSACGSDDGEGASPTITVLAAASLQGTFTQLGEEFEADNPDVQVTFSFGASSALAQQIVQGAPADVFAAASESTMQQVVDAGEAPDSTPFAANSLAIAVPPGNPGKVRGIGDLTSPKVKVALCQPQVPCGAAAKEALDSAGLVVRPATEEADVSATLTKAKLGEVDAAVVYVTDVQAAGDAVQAVEIPKELNVTTTYPVAPLRAAGNPEAAARFVDFVLSERGQAVLAAAGFARP